MKNRDDTFHDVRWLTDAFAADWNPGFVREFRAWMEEERERPLSEVVRAWTPSSWTVH